MATIRTKKASHGMVVSKDVLDISGRMLVPKGTSLTEQHLKVFQTWGIAEIDVESEEGIANDAEPDIAEEFLAEARQQLDKRFIVNDREHPLIQELYTLAVNKRALELQNEAGK